MLLGNSCQRQNVQRKQQVGTRAALFSHPRAPAGKGRPSVGVECSRVVVLLPASPVNCPAKVSSSSL